MLTIQARKIGLVRTAQVSLENLYSNSTSIFLNYHAFAGHMQEKIDAGEHT